MITRLLGERIGGLPACRAQPDLAGIGRALIMEGGMGVSSGHAEARAFVEQWLEADGGRAGVAGIALWRARSPAANSSR